MFSKKGIYLLIILLGIFAILFNLKSSRIELESENLDKVYEKYTQTQLEISNDSNLLRRLSLHLRGTIPDGKESLAFVNDKDSEKFRRTSLIYIRVQNLPNTGEPNWALYIEKRPIAAMKCMLAFISTLLALFMKTSPMIKW